MQTPAQRGERIVAALEDLVGQESAALRDGDFSVLQEMADRIAPLVDAVVKFPATDFAPGLRGRIAALRAVRANTLETLAAAMVRNRSELRAAETTGRRVARIAPAYGLGRSAGGQLQFVG